MKYFSIKELYKSTVAIKKGIDNTPSQEIQKRLEILIDKCLDPIREKFGFPITVSSGYRCPALNTAVGGELSSHHLTGFAADIDTSDNIRLWEVITSGDFKWTQLINEYPDENGEPSWIHISYDPSNLKCEKLICKNGKYYKC